MLLRLTADAPTQPADESKMVTMLAYIGPGAGLVSSWSAFAGIVAAAYSQSAVPSRVAVPDHVAVHPPRVEDASRRSRAWSVDRIEALDPRLAEKVALESFRQAADLHSLADAGRWATASSRSRRAVAWVTRSAPSVSRRRPRRLFQVRAGWARSLSSLGLSMTVAHSRTLFMARNFARSASWMRLAYLRQYTSSSARSRGWPAPDCSWTPVEVRDDRIEAAVLHGPGRASSPRLQRPASKQQLPACRMESVSAARPMGMEAKGAPSCRVRPAERSMRHVDFGNRIERREVWRSAGAASEMDGRVSLYVTPSTSIRTIRPCQFPDPKF